MASRSSRSQDGIAQWRPRHYVLAGMGIILALSTVTVVTSIILQPTEIHFSISDFSRNQNPTIYQVEDNSEVIVFNLMAYNPSHRAGVVYDSVLVSMQLQSPNVRKTSVPALVTDDKSMLHQGTNSNRTMRVEAILDNRFLGFCSKPSATINVFAQAHFKVGLSKSRVYNIRVECSRIDLSSLGARSRTTNCSALN